MEEEALKKANDAMAKDFYNKVFVYNEKNLHNEYEQTLSQLSSLYGKRTLVNILAIDELLPLILKTLLGDASSIRKFVCFIKSSFHEAIIMKLTGSKILYKQMKTIIKNVI